MLHVIDPLGTNAQQPARNSPAQPSPIDVELHSGPINLPTSPPEFNSYVSLRLPKDSRFLKGGLIF